MAGLKNRGRIEARLERIPLDQVASPIRPLTMRGEGKLARVLFPIAAAIGLTMAGCSGTSPQPPPGSPPPTGPAAATSEPSPSISGGQTETTAPARNLQPGDGVPDNSGRYAYVCTSQLDVPEVTLSSLAEVWANPGYLRMDSCTAEYRGPEPFVPTEAEADIIATADPQVAPSDGLDLYLKALSLCTRVSDDAASAVFGGSSRRMLLAASELCSKGPQGKIIALWAEGARAGDGKERCG